MAKNKRKKTQKEADFKKVKLKVGKTLPKGTNDTQTTFKSQEIVVPLQDLVKDGQLTNMKKQNLKDLLSHMNHYSSTVRHDSLIGLRALFQQHISELHDNLSLVLTSIADKMTDTDSDVRRSLLLLLQFILPQIDSDQVVPFLSLLVAHLSCAMTHIFGEIQLSSLKFLHILLEYFPVLMKCHCKQVLDNLLGLISNYSGESQRTAKAKISVVADGKLASHMSKIKILNQILHLLKIVYERGTVKGHDTNLKCSPVHFVQESETYIPMFVGGAQVPKLQRFSFQYNVDANNTSNSASIKELMQRTIPLLLELWVECCPSTLATSLPNNALSSSNLSVMMTIMSILKLLLNALNIEDNSVVIQEWFVSTYYKDFKNHFMKFFPFQGSFVSKSKGKSKMAESSDGDVVLMLDVSICEVMSVFTGIDHATKHEPWMENVEEFIVGTLGTSSSKLKVEHLNSILVYVNQVVHTRLSEGEAKSTTNLLGSLFREYQSSHLLSAIKTELMTFFAALYFKVYKLNVSGLKDSVSLKSIMDKWANSLPKLLVQHKTSNPEIICMVVKLLSKLVDQSANSINCQEIQKKLTSYLVSGGLSKLSIGGQKSVVELIFSLPTLENELLQTLALCCQQRDIDVDVVQYLVHVIHYRSEACLELINKTAAVSLSSYLSFLFSVAIGYSTKTLCSLQTNSEDQQMYKMHEEEHEQEPQKVWQRHHRIVEIVCMMYQQMHNSKNLLKQMEPALDNLLKFNKTLPVPAASSVLKLFKCYLKLANTTDEPSSSSHLSSLSTSFIDHTAELSLSCLLYSIEQECLLDSDVQQSLYNDVVDIVQGCPVVFECLLSLLSARITDKDDRALLILSKLLQSLSCSTTSSLPDGVVQLISDMMDKIHVLWSSGSPLISDLEYQFSLFMIEFNRTNKQK